MILEAAFIAALGQGLVKALEKLLEKGLIDPALETGTESFSRWLTHWYRDEDTRRKTVEALRKAVLSALDDALQNIPKKDARRVRVHQQAYRAARRSPCLDCGRIRRDHAVQTKDCSPINWWGCWIGSLKSFLS